MPGCFVTLSTEIEIASLGILLFLMMLSMLVGRLVRAQVLEARLSSNPIESIENDKNDMAK